MAKFYRNYLLLLALFCQKVRTVVHVMVLEIFFPFQNLLIVNLITFQCIIKVQPVYNMYYDMKHPTNVYIYIIY